MASWGFVSIYPQTAIEAAVGAGEVPDRSNLAAITLVPSRDKDDRVDQ
jgi:hypothetical protein